MTPPLETLTAAAVAALSAVPRSTEWAAGLSDAALLQQVEVASTLQRLATTHAALLAGEVARRSAPSLGQSGLAQRTGFRTAEQLVQVATGSTKQQAVHAVRVGRMVVDAASSEPAQPWLRPVSAALRSSTLSSAAADAIRAGLGEPSDVVSAAALESAAERLCLLGIDADQLYRRAREERDSIDEAGIADRERVLRDQRGLRFTRLPDGMSRLTWMLDPESAATCAELFDRATSPRRGGPRFVNPDDAELSDSVIADERTTEQIASDVFLELLRQGAAHDSSRLLSTGAPVVRAVVTVETLSSRRGHGWIEGQHSPVSVQTIERLACGGAVQQVTVNESNQPLALGREQRLFSRHQRTALAIRDGGCRWPGCDRPPSWTEAHHTRHWARDGGETNVSNGLLLCRHHHLLLHNNGWEIRQRDAEFWLIPPASIDPNRQPRSMPSASPLVRERQRSRERQLERAG